MRKASEIRQKLKQVKFRYLSKLLTAKLSPRPSNCLHNGTLDVPEKEPALHICTLKLDDGSWNGGICDEEHGGLERAKKCPHFCPRQSKDAIKADFRDFFDTAEYGQIAYLYPMAAGLIWALGDELDEPEGDLDPEPTEEPASEVPQVPDAATLDKLSAATEEESQDAVSAALDHLAEKVSQIQSRMLTEEGVKSIVDKAIESQPDHGARIDDLVESIDRRFEEQSARFEEQDAKIDAQPVAEPKTWLQRLLGV